MKFIPLTIVAACSLLSGAHAAVLFTNPITGSFPILQNPYTAGQTVIPNITVSGIGRGTGLGTTNGDDRYVAASWTTAATPDANDYFTFTLTPDSGYEIDFTSFVYTGQISSAWTTAGTAQFAFRSSLDGFTANIGAPTATGATISLTDAAYQNVISAITFRIYAYGAPASSSTFSVNDFTFNGDVNAVPEPSTYALLALGTLLIAYRLRRRTVA